MTKEVLELVRVFGARLHRSSRFRASPTLDGAANDAGVRRQVEVFVSRDYEPSRIRVKDGERVRLTFIRTMWNGTAPELVIPSLAIRRELRRHEPVVVELPALAPGTYPFGCGTGTMQGTITVAAAR